MYLVHRMSSSRKENFLKINKETIVVAIESWIMHNLLIDKHILSYQSSYLHYNKKVCLLHISLGY